VACRFKISADALRDIRVDGPRALEGLELPSVLVENLSTAEEFKFNSSTFPINNFFANQSVEAVAVTSGGTYVTWW
jgi:hypothetical protein